MVSRLAAVFFLVFFLVHGMYAIHVGPLFPSDTYRYTSEADRLIREQFNLFSYLRGGSFVVPEFFYLGFVLLVALAKIALGEFWTWGIVGLNLIASSLTGFLLVSLIHEVTKNRWAATVGGILFLCSFEIFQWIPYLLTDSTYLLLSFSLYLTLARIFRNDKEAKGFWAVGVVLGLITVFYRPTAVIHVPLILFCFLLWLEKRAPNARYRNFLWGGLGCFLGLLLLSHTVIMRNPEMWPKTLLGRGYIDYIANDYSRGVVIFDRPHTFVAAPKETMDFLKITALKFVGFFWPTDQSFSLSHRLISYFFHLPCLFGLLVLLVMKPHWSSENREWPLVLNLLFVLAISLFAALTQVDYDWRYRLPAMPHLVFWASLGIDRLFAGGTRKE